LNEHISNNSTDYKELVEQLKEKKSGLIKSCTMRGERHDELHKWVHRQIVLIEALSKAASVKEASETINNLQKSFITYHKYFQ